MTSRVLRSRSDSYKNLIAKTSYRINFAKEILNLKSENQSLVDLKNLKTRNYSVHRIGTRLKPERELASVTRGHLAKN